MNFSEIKHDEMEYLSNGIHSITIGLVDPEGKPYTKCMDILSADSFGGIYIYAENTDKVDECLRHSSDCAFTGITGCAFSHVKEINFSGTLEKVDDKFAEELLMEDQHALEHRHTEGDDVNVGIYRVMSGGGTFEEVNRGTAQFQL